MISYTILSNPFKSFGILVVGIIALWLSIFELSNSDFESLNTRFKFRLLFNLLIRVWTFDFSFSARYSVFVLGYVMKPPS